MDKERKISVGTKALIEGYELLISLMDELTKRWEQQVKEKPECTESLKDSKNAHLYSVMITHSYAPTLLSAEVEWQRAGGHTMVEVPVLDLMKISKLFNSDQDYFNDRVQQDDIPQLQAIEAYSEYFRDKLSTADEGDKLENFGRSVRDFLGRIRN